MIATETTVFSRAGTSAVAVATSRFTAFDALGLLLLFGYLLGGRSFAHLGVSPIYIGELSLAAFFLLQPAAMVWPWVRSLTNPTAASTFGWSLLISLMFAAMQLFRSFAGQGFVLSALQNAVFHFYPLFLFTGLWMGVRHPDSLPRLVRALAWANGIYGILYIGLFSPLGLTADETNPEYVPWFGQAGGCGLAILGLLAFEKDVRRAIVPFLINLLVVLAMQRRAEWLGLLVGVVVWAYLSRQLQRLMLFGAAILLLLVAAMVVDIRLPGPATRGGEISTRHLAARVIAVVDPQLALSLSPDAETLSDTVSWRTEFWTGIWKQVHESPNTTLFGLGYDYPLSDLHPLDLGEEGIRSPHNIFMFVLGYTGWVGVLVFCGLQFGVARLLWNTYRTTGQAFGICYWVFVLVWAPFDVFFETPFSAIPTYMLLGIAAAGVFSPAVRTTEPSELAEDPRLLRNGLGHEVWPFIRKVPR